MKIDLEARTEKFAHIRDIAGIPASVTEEHNECYYHWEKSGIKNADLFHIDSHPDTVHADLKAYFSSYKDLTIINFICAAVHKGVVSSMYWYDPYLQFPLADMGSTKKDNRKSLNTKIENGSIIWEDSELCLGRRDILQVSDLRIKSPLILDIDLDAFAMKFEETGYKERIDQSIEALKSVQKPDLITITRSQGPDHPDPSAGRFSSLRVFVDPLVVDDVQDYLIHNLNILYRRK
jgi:hypothetical protein